MTSVFVCLVYVCVRVCRQVVQRDGDWREAGAEDDQHWCRCAGAAAGVRLHRLAGHPLGQRQNPAGGRQQVPVQHLLQSLRVFLRYVTQKIPASIR